MKRGGVAFLLLAGFLLGRTSLALPAWAQGEPEEPTEPTEPPSEASPTRELLAVPEGQPRYLDAMRAELDRMGQDGTTCAADDADHAHCLLHYEGTGAEGDLDINLAYSDVTDTLYFYVQNFLSVPSDGEHTDAVMRRMMELNWTMLLAKFEWDPSDGEVRIGTVLHTDSNFDRRAFRSAVRAIRDATSRFRPELDHIRTSGR